jgi:hypothetical protein
MKALYQNKKVKVTKIVVAKQNYITHPILVQVLVRWEENGKTVSTYVDANAVEFID